MSDNTTPSGGTKGKKIVKGAAFGCLGIFLVVIVLAIIISPKKDTPATGSLPATVLDTASTSASTTDSSPEPAETAHSAGMGKSRDDFEKVLTPLGFTFEQAKAVRGMPRVMGKAASINCIVELMGPEEDLSEADAVVLVSSEQQANTVALGSLLLVAMAVEKESSEWITDQIKKVEKGQSTTETRVFGGKTFALSINLNETLPMMSLKITR